MSRDPEELVNLAAQPTHQTRLKRMRQQAVDELRRTDVGLLMVFQRLPQPAFEPLTRRGSGEGVSLRVKGMSILVVAADFDNDGHLDVLSA